MKRYKNHDRILNIGIIRKKFILRFDVTFVFFSSFIFFIYYVPLEVKLKMVDLTKIEYRVLISLYECEGGITKRNFVKKYPEFKLNTAYLVIDRLVDKGYLEMNYSKKTKLLEKLFSPIKSITDFYSDMFGICAVDRTVKKVIRELTDYSQTSFILDKIREAKRYAK